VRVYFCFEILFQNRTQFLTFAVMTGFHTIYGMLAKHPLIGFAIFVMYLTIEGFRCHIELERPGFSPKIPAIGVHKQLSERGDRRGRQWLHGWFGGLSAGKSPRGENPGKRSQPRFCGRIQRRPGSRGGGLLRAAQLGRRGDAGLDRTGGRLSGIPSGHCRRAAEDPFLSRKKQV